jgi:hypothetical protein
MLQVKHFVLIELPAGGDDDNCCAYTILAKKTVANTNIIVIATTLNMVRLCMVECRSDLIYISYKYKIDCHRRKIKT